MIEEEIGFLRSELSRVIGEIPGNSLVGLITFGRYVCVHELGFLGRVLKVYVFNGAKEITKDQVLEQMWFFLKKPRPVTGVVASVRDGLSQESINRFLIRPAHCEFALNLVLDELQKDPWPVPADQRIPRSIGIALTVAVHLFGVCVPGARIMAFLGFEQLSSALLFYSLKISKWL